MSHPSPLRAVVLGLVLAVCGGERAAADEFCYVLIFGSQSSPKQLRYTHTWATFVKAEGVGTDPAGYALTTQTISWLPRTLEVKVLRPCPEEGVNLSLEDTLRAMYANGEHVTMWGPFIMRKEVFERASRVISILNSGRAEYRAISTARNMLISDCIHAVAAVDPEFGRGHYPLIRIGKPASRFIARQVMMRSVFDQTAYDNSLADPAPGAQQLPDPVRAPR
jgi:hypothetical protein